ncbi:MAG TPA: hypothetical protein VKK19_02680 [Candidatus Dormibacteraeota bacterium]|nr:hypothetical protein [Candidatus Dormibacteraeota bacterium]
MPHFDLNGRPSHVHLDVTLQLSGSPAGPPTRRAGGYHRADAQIRKGMRAPG